MKAPSALQKAKAEVHARHEDWRAACAAWHLAGGHLHTPTHRAVLAARDRSEEAAREVGRQLQIAHAAWLEAGGYWPQESAR